MELKNNDASKQHLSAAWRWFRSRSKKVQILLVVVALFVFGTFINGIESGAKTEQSQASPTEAKQEKPLPAESQATVEKAKCLVNLKLTGSIQGDVLTIAGTASLPDGALIAWEAGDPLIKTPSGTSAFAEGTSVITNGAFKSEINVNGWPSKFEVWAGFQTILGTDKHQPQAIIDLCGEKGERIEDDKARKVGDILSRVEAKVTVKYELDEASYRAQCQNIEYRVLKKNPENYTGQKYSVKGQVSQILESISGGTVLRVDVTDQGYDIWTDTIYVEFVGTTTALEKSIVNIYGEILGSKTYESQAGWNITLPHVEAKYIDVVQQ